MPPAAPVPRWDSANRVSAVAMAAADADRVPPRDPIRVVLIVSFGFETKSGATFLADVEDSEFKIVDLRKKLPKDPSVVVGHQENGSHPQTQRAVYSQAGFPNVIIDSLLKFESGVDMLALGCTHGWHRSDTAARALEDIANSLVDQRGNRLYNAKHFGLSSAYGRRGFEQMIRDAKEWISSPWCLVEGGPREPRQSFGYEACMGSRLAAEGWQTIREYLDDNYPGPAATAVPGAAAEDEERDRGQPLLPRPPAVPPPTHLVGEPQDAAKEERQHADDAAHEPTIDNRPSRGAKRGRGTDVDDEGDSWITFSSDPEVWSKFLDEAGVDVTAKQELFLLCQHSKEGYEHGNSIIAKILKKRADREAISNISGFVHRCVVNARSQMGSWAFRSSASSSGGKGKSGGKDVKRW